MPDITMCTGGECPIRERCYRFKATPSEYRQSYFAVVPYAVVDGGERGECRHYVPVAPGVGGQGDE